MRVGTCPHQQRARQMDNKRHMTGTACSMATQVFTERRENCADQLNHFKLAIIDFLILAELSIKATKRWKPSFSKPAPYILFYSSSSLPVLVRGCVTSLRISSFSDDLSSKMMSAGRVSLFLAKKPAAL